MTVIERASLRVELDKARLHLTMAKSLPFLRDYAPSAQARLDSLLKAEKNAPRTSGVLDHPLVRELVDSVHREIEEAGEKFATMEKRLAQEQEKKAK